MMLLRRSGEGVICLARELFTFYELFTAVSTGNLKKTLKRLAKKIDPRNIYMFNARVAIQFAVEKARTLGGTKTGKNDVVRGR